MSYEVFMLENSETMLEIDGQLRILLNIVLYDVFFSFVKLDHTLKY